MLQETAEACLAAGAESADIFAVDLSVDKVWPLDGFVYGSVAEKNLTSLVEHSLMKICVLE